MTEYTLHYGGESFELLSADEVETIEQAFTVVGGGNTVVVTLDRLEDDGRAVTRRFFFSEGVPIYLEGISAAG